jgi:hypothetical protein
MASDRGVILFVDGTLAACLYTHDGGHPRWVVPEIRVAYLGLLEDRSDIFGRPTRAGSFQAYRGGYLASALCATSPRSYSVVPNILFGDLDHFYLVTPTRGELRWDVHYVDGNIPIAFLRKIWRAADKDGSPHGCADILLDRYAFPVVDYLDAEEWPYLGNPVMMPPETFRIRLWGDHHDVRYGDFATEAEAMSALEIKLKQRGGSGVVQRLAPTVIDESPVLKESPDGDPAAAAS